MIVIGFIYLPVLLHPGYQKPGLFKPVQFQPDEIRGFIEFRFQIPEIEFRVTVQEEPEQHLDAGFAGD